MTTRTIRYVVYQSHLSSDAVSDAQADGYAEKLCCALRDAFPGVPNEVRVVRRTQGVGSGLQNPDAFTTEEQDLISHLAERTQVPEERACDRRRGLGATRGGR